MKSGLRRSVFVVVMVTGSAALTGHATGEFRMLYGFSQTTNGRNADGAHPNGGLVLTGGNLYGTAVGGGSWGQGTVFSVNTDGGGFTTLHDFSALTGPFLSETNRDGSQPQGGLILRSNVLYGMANNGGAGAVGTVFKLKTDGSEFSTLHAFGYALARLREAGFPESSPMLVGDTLYGTAQGGGDCDNGLVYRINTDGSEYGHVFSFCFAQNHHWTLSGLVGADGALYGCSAGGQGMFWIPGTVFKVRTNGSDFSLLHIFSETEGLPVGRLVLSGNTLYGTAFPGTDGGGGMVFKLNTEGTQFEALYRFSGGSDGTDPGGLVLSGTVLYGTTGRGGSLGKGTVFALNTDGTGFQTLYTFTGGQDGAFPKDELVWSGGKLYGSTFSAGPSGSGTLFSLSVVDLPELIIHLSGSSVRLTWPSETSGFSLQFSGSLGADADWKTVEFPPPVLVDRQCVVILPCTTTSPQQFYRLSR